MSTSSFIVDLTGDDESLANKNVLRLGNESVAEEEDKLIQLFRIEAKIVGKRFYKEKLNDGELVYLGTIL